MVKNIAEYPTPNIEREMFVQRKNFARYGWVLSEPHPSSAFTSLYGPEFYGYKLMPDGNYYLLQCPLDGLSPGFDFHQQEPDHDAKAMAEAMRRLGE